MSEALALPFNRLKQRAILGHLLTDRKFFAQCRQHLKPNWFTEEPINGKIFSILLQYVQKYQGSFPSIEAVNGHSDVMSEPVAEQLRIQKQIVLCVEETKNFEIAHIRDDLSDWLTAITFRDGIGTAQAAYNRGDFKQVSRIWQEISEKARDVTFDDYGIQTFDSYEKDIEDEVNGRAGALTTGLTLLDNALLDGAINGGLQLGDTTVIVAPTNIGKTTTMITIAVANVKRGRSVLFMTHEGRFKDIKTKIWQCMLGVTKQELFALYTDPAGAKRMQIMMKFLNEHLVYIPYNKPGMTVETVAAIIARAQQDRIAKTGKGFAMLVSDYPAKLSTERAAKGNLPRREIDRIVYDYYVQMALDNDFHSLVAIQTNREGSKINKQQNRETRLLTMEDASEAFGPMEMATNVITGNRSPRAQINNRMTFLVDKSRSSQKGLAVVAKTDFARAITHDDRLGGVWYRGYGTMDDQIDDLLKQYHGTAIPEHLVKD